MEEKTKQHVDIVFCLTGDKRTKFWSQQFNGVISQLSEAGYSSAISDPPYNANIYYARRRCLSGDAVGSINQPLFGGEFTYDYTCWIDSDNIVTYDNIKKLLDSDKDIVCGAYHMNDGKNFAQYRKFDLDYYDSHGRFEAIDNDTIQELLKGEDRLIELAGSGFGCMLIKSGVFEKIGYPWFKPASFKVKSSGVVDFMSEDLSFCLFAKKAGFTTYMHLDVIIPHEKIRYI